MLRLEANVSNARNSNRIRQAGSTLADISTSGTLTGSRGNRPRRRQRDLIQCSSRRNAGGNVSRCMIEPDNGATGGHLPERPVVWFRLSFCTNERRIRTRPISAEQSHKIVGLTGKKNDQRAISQAILRRSKQSETLATPDPQMLPRRPHGAAPDGPSANAADFEWPGSGARRTRRLRRCF